MHHYQANARNLAAFLQDGPFVRIENRPHLQMEIACVDAWPLVYVRHCNSLDGDPTRGVTVGFWVSEEQKGVVEARPVYFQDHHTGKFFATIENCFQPVVPVESWRQWQLDKFCAEWWEIIDEQGYLKKAKEMAAAQPKQERNAAPDTDPGPEMDH
jgi:hypothetical protein